MKLIPKPVELVEAPLDGQYAFIELKAPPDEDIFPHQVVRNNNGTAVLATGADPNRFFEESLEGYYLALSDTGPTLKQGSSESLGEIGFRAARPDKVRVVSIGGKKAIISAKGKLSSSHFGNYFGLLQEGRYTVLDLSNTARAAAKVLAVVEGNVGDEYARVLVEFP